MYHFLSVKNLVSSKLSEENKGQSKCDQGADHSSCSNTNITSTEVWEGKNFSVA